MTSRPIWCPELERTGCPLGCPSGDDLILCGRDRLHGLPGEFSVVRCRSCGLMRTDPRPTLEAMQQYYPEDYGPHATLPPATQATITYHPAWKRFALRGYERVFSRVFRFNAEILPKIPPGRMLEVGCATGAFLWRMAHRGWEVEGLEASNRAAALARSRGFRVKIGTLESILGIGGPYELLVGWMVLEHLHDPLGGLRKLRRWARPGGVAGSVCPECRLSGVPDLRRRLVRPPASDPPVPLHAQDLETPPGEIRMEDSARLSAACREQSPGERWIRPGGSGPAAPSGWGVDAVSDGRRPLAV